MATALLLVVIVVVVVDDDGDVVIVVVVDGGEGGCDAGNSDKFCYWWRGSCAVWCLLWSQWFGVPWLCGVVEEGVLWFRASDIKRRKTNGKNAVCSLVYPFF